MPSVLIHLWDEYSDTEEKSRSFDPTMNAKSAVTPLVAALAAFAVGWILAGSGGDETAASSRINPGEEPAVALGTILRIEDPIDRTTELLALLERTDPSAALVMFELLESRDPDLIVEEITQTLFAAWWARESPGVAFSHPINPLYPDPHPWMRTVFREWARQNPVEAAIAVRTVLPGRLKGRLEGSRAVVDEWLKLDPMPDPSLLLSVVTELDPMPRAGAIEHLLSSMMKDRGIDETLDFVRSIPPDGTLGGSVQHEVQSRTSVALLDYDVERAVAWAAEFADHPNWGGVHRHLAYYWGLKEGLPAIEWALALPDVPEKSMIVKRAWLSFSRKHREEARAWITARPPDQLMRGSYTAYIRGMAAIDPDGALELANRAETLELRHAMLAAAGKGWMRHDPTAATAWLAGAGLPPKLERAVRAIKPVPPS